MDLLDTALMRAFPGRAVRKDLVKRVRGNASVPNYVLEYLLASYCATDDEAAVERGVDRVRQILAKNYVQRAEAGALKSDIREHGRKRLLDKVSVFLDEKKDRYYATVHNLSANRVAIEDHLVRANRRLLVSGVWCQLELGYLPEASDQSPFILVDLRPIQVPNFDLTRYLESRAQMTSADWTDALIRTLGLEPAELSRREKLLQLLRLVPYCEKNYNLIELGPKGTGKSHVYSEFSPHGMLVSGGEVTPAKLFVNNASGRIGLVGFWDVVAFDEFAGPNKRPKPDIVDIMKNYMANKSFSRGVEQVTAEASFAFVGNTSHDVGYMINKTDLFEDLPEVYHDSAFIDRIHAYLPGWEVQILRPELFSAHYGLVVDYLAEALRTLRNDDYSGLWRQHFELSEDLSTRDLDGVQKTFSGLMKVLYPGRDATADEVLEVLEFSLEMRERVKDSLMRIDETYARAHFRYRMPGGDWVQVATLEELEYPAVYHALDKVPVDGQEVERERAWSGAGGTEPNAAARPATAGLAGAGAGAESAGAVASAAGAAPAAGPAVAAAPSGADALFSGHKAFRGGQRGVSFERLFGAYLEGATQVRIVDPYIRKFYQVRNLMELLEVLVRHRDWSKPDPVVELTTAAVSQAEAAEVAGLLDQVQAALAQLGIKFSYRVSRGEGLHARHIYIDDAWDISIDRGLDIFQWFDAGDQLALENRMPELRRVRPFEVDYRKLQG